MPGTIIENLSNRKLSVLVAILLTCQICCFLVGVISPRPATSQGLLATQCIDSNPDPADLTKWFDRKSCKPMPKYEEHELKNIDANNIVFVVEMPLYGLDFTRWQQNLVGVLEIDALYHKDLKEMDPVVELTLDARLAYSNEENGKRTPWAYYAHSEEKRVIECVMGVRKKEHLYPYNCSMVPLFELGSLHHDFYLLNLRLPYNFKLKKNTELTAHIDDVYLHVIHMNGGFTQVWLGLKSFFFPVILGLLFWFWRRVTLLSRTPALLEYMLLGLGGTLAFLDVPLEYLSLWFEMPFMLLLSDVRQGVFYAMLLSFWLVFAGEHMLIQDNGEKNTLRMYWKHLSSILTGCMSLLVFDLCERGVQLANPFYSIWVTPIGTNLALSFIILAGISASIYFIFLCYMIWCVFKNISLKRSVLPNMSQARRLHYEGIIYRFNFLMLATVICAAVTIISFILSQVADGENKWDENLGLELSSVMQTGVYGMWNVYICAMLMLYAPSHKQWPSETICDDGEEVEFNRLPVDQSPNEISSLTSFASKANID